MCSKWQGKDGIEDPGALHCQSKGLQEAERDPDTVIDHTTY